MIIKTESLTKILDNKKVLDDINCEFHSGNIYGIVGQNGSGKTMLLRALSGLIHSTKGSVMVDDKRMFKDIFFPPNLGIVIEKPELIPYISGFENLKWLAEIRHVITNQDIKKYMKLFALDPESKQQIKKYSLGMKQKLGIIQAVMEDPEVLMLDEPFNALDAEAVNVLRKMLLKFKENQKLIIITSHHQEDIDSVCNCVIHLQDGHICSSMAEGYKSTSCLS